MMICVASQLLWVVLPSPITQIFSGNRVAEGAVPFAHCYGGFQFGNWAGQLGDGRALSLGHVIQLRKVLPPKPGDASNELAVEALDGGGSGGSGGAAALNTVVDEEDKEVGRWELQLKGAGRTPCVVGG